MPITALPAPPSRSDAPQDFSDRADALLGALPLFVTEANALQTEVNANEQSALNAAISASNSAAQAQDSAATATTKAGEASASAAAAAASASSAAIAFDSFDDKYLGAKSSDPTTDNDGDALIPGAIYWNTTLSANRVWNGVSWQTAINPSDSSAVEFQHAGTGAVARTAQDKMREWVSVKDFGAVGNGVTDDTAAIQAAINAVGSSGGGVVRFPAGTYRLTSAINLSRQSVTIDGGSRFGTVLRQDTADARILNITGNFCNVKNISFLYGSTPTLGATAIYVTSAYVTLSDFIVRSSRTGVHFDGRSAVAGKVVDFEILDYESIGLYASNLNDLFVSRFIINAGNTTRGALGGIRLLDKVEAFICTDGDILLGQYSMTMDATSYTLGNRPAYNNFTNVFFDSAINATWINKCVETEFVGCWFSGGRSGGGNAGALVSQSQSIRFTNCRFFNNGAQGVALQSSASDVTFIGCKAESNSVTTGAGVSHGFQVANNTTQFQFIGCTASNGLYTGIQEYGIFIGSGCDQFVVRDCNLVGNAAGAMLDGSSATADKTIHGNIGYRTSNTGQATIAAGTTSVVVSHGLAVAPRLQDIVLTRQSTNAGSIDLFVSNITATQFQINTAPAPSVNITITWHARCSGA